MEGDSHASTSLEWENLALYSAGRSIQIPQQFGFSSPITSAASLKFPAAPSYEDLMNVACSPEPMIGLRLGQHKEYAARTTPADMPVSTTPTKRSRASYHSMQNPCCQVEGCNLDLKLAKDYHRRHRICETHSKSPKVIVAGLERRFCQQCSRFHDLSEFDDKKRSCRRRLSDHNARRRRVQPESVQLTSAALSPAALYDRQQNVLLNGLPVSLPNSRWETSISLSRPSKHSFSCDNPHMDPRSNPRILDQCLHVGSSSHSSMAPELVSAHSLLSSSTWSMNDVGESSYCSPMMRHSPHGQFHIHDHVDEAIDAASPSHLQEYHLFNESAASFYPPTHHRTL